MLQIVRKAVSRGGGVIQHHHQKRAFSEALGGATLSLNKKRVAGKDEAVTAKPVGIETATAITGLKCSVVTQPGPELMAHLNLVFNSGARHESNSERGLSHFVRRSVGNASQRISGFATTRHIEQMGAALQVSTSREHTIFSLSLPHNLVEVGAQLLNSAVNEPKYYEWELSRNVYPLMRYDLEQLNRRQFDTLTYELLHEAAFRRGLANSVFSLPYRIGAYSFEQIDAFHSKAFNIDRAHLICSGVHSDVSNALRLGNMFESMRPSIASDGDQSGGEKMTAARGEVRRELPINRTHVMLAWHTGAGLDRPTEATAIALAVRALGIGCSHGRIRWGGGGSANSRLERALQMSGGSTAEGSTSTADFSCNTFNLCYSDAGLAGLHLIGRPDAVAHALSRSITAMRGLVNDGLTEQEVETARNSLRCDLLALSESANDYTQMLAYQTSSSSTGNGKLRSAEEIVRGFDAVTAEKVNSVAKQVFAAPAGDKVALAAVGELDKLPYLEDLL